jgi:hypothetical protein
MNKAVVVVLLSLLVIACKEVSFREPQPRGRRALSSIPQKLQGKYLAYQDNGEISRDTVVITPNGYRFSYYEPVPPSNHRDEYEEGVLSDSLVLKSYRGYYFLNLLERNEWLLRVIQQQRNGDLSYLTMEQENVDFKDYVRKLSYEIPIDSVQVGDVMQYHIDPSPSKLVDLIEKGFFTKTQLKKVD